MLNRLTTSLSPEEREPTLTQSLKYVLSNYAELKKNYQHVNVEELVEQMISLGADINWVEEGRSMIDEMLAGQAARGHR